MSAFHQLAGTPHEPYLRLLELFAYGTYADAQAKVDELPKLTGFQVLSREAVCLTNILCWGGMILAVGRVSGKR